MIFIKKIVIDTCILNKDSNEKTTFEHIDGFYDHNNAIITYKELDSDNTDIKIKYRKKTIEILRENDKIQMKLNFDLNSTTKGIFYIKELNINIDIDINTEKIIINKDCISIEYSLKLGDTDFTKYEFVINFKGGIE